MKPAILLLLSVSLLGAVPPRFEITAHAIYSGAVMADSGGRFSLTGTAGQPEAVPEFASVDSRFSLYPGFWPVAVILTAPDSPELRFLPAAPGQSTVAWPVTASGWILEQSHDLQSWSPVAAPVVNTASDHTVTMPGAGGRVFLRLRCQ